MTEKRHDEKNLMTMTMMMMKNQCDKPLFPQLCTVVFHRRLLNAPTAGQRQSVRVPCVTKLISEKW